MNVTKEEIKQFLKDSIEWLVDQDQGCSTLALDDRLAICVGWLDGYDENDEDVIHSKEEPKYAINAGIKVYTSDDMRTDYEFINNPYYDNGEVVQSDVSVQPNADLDELADYFIKEYAGLENLEIEEDGRIIENNFDAAYEKVDDESSNESLKEDFSKWVEDIAYELDVSEDWVQTVLDTQSFDSYKDALDYCREIVAEAKAKELTKQESCENKEVKESWEGESIIDDLIERAQSMYDEGGYGDIDDCVAQAIDDGLIYSDDILELAKHYGTLDDSELISDYYEELFYDVASRVEEHEEPEEDDFEDGEEETDESLKEGKNPKSMSKEELEAEYKRLKDEMKKVRDKNPTSNYLKDLQARLDKIAKYHSKYGKFTEELENEDDYFNPEKMTLGDIRTAPIGWTWSCDGMEIAKVDANTLKSPEWGDDGDDIEDYIDGMLAEFDEDTTLDEIGDSELYLTNEDELEYYPHNASLTPEEEEEKEEGKRSDFENIIKWLRAMNKV